MSAVWPYLAAIVPTILVAILFYFLIRSMLEGDRRERLAQSQYEAAQARRHAARGEPSGKDGSGESGEDRRPAQQEDSPEQG